MSGPSTKRDQRRETRRAQFQQRQEERRRARERARRQQQLQRIGIAVGVIAVVGLLIWGAFAVFSPRPAHHPTSPATGDTVDNIPCTAGEMLQVHYHASLQIYVNGQPQQLPAGVGIVEPNTVSQQQYAHLASNGQTACLYYLHTHDATGIVHIESPSTDTYTLGQFFDIWGQSLDRTHLLGNKTDAAHRLVVEVFDANGKLTTYTGDPSQIHLSAHETIYLLYNSPNVRPAPYTQWNGL
jgi:hypothetical protein